MILYFGNKLKKNRRITSMMESLEPFLRQIVEIKTFSEKSSYTGKIADVTMQLLRHCRKTSLMLIDVFSSKNIYYALYISWLAKLAGLPYVLILRGGNLPEKAKSNTFIIRLLFKRAKHIVAPSGYLYDAFKPSYQQTILIPNIVDASLYPYQEREIKAPKIIYIRGFGKVYNPSMLIRAVGLLKESYPGIEVVMMGNDHGDNTMETCRQLVTDMGLEKNISLRGSMAKEEWIALSESFNIMVSTPMIDNTPVSVIEGMMLGLPVISTNVGGIGYLLDDRVTGLLIEADNPEQLAEAVSLLTENQSLANNVVRNARKKAESFGWNHIKPLWEKILKSDE